MRTRFDQSDPHPDPADISSLPGRMVRFGLIAIALVLAIGFFYLTDAKRRDRPAEAVTQAAASVDHAARAVGDAARNTADDLRNRN